VSSPLVVEPVDWPELKKRFRTLFLPGQHLAVAAPTGEGKTTTVGGILSNRRFVLAMDQKGGDDTLDQFPGYRRVVTWPDRQTKKDITDGKPARLIVGRLANEIGDLDRNVVLQGQVLEAAWREKGWTVYIPDLQILTDRRLANLGSDVDKFLIAARNRKISVVTDFQELTNISKLAYRMASWFVVGFTKDYDTIDNLARATGRSAAEMRGLIRELPEYHFLVIPKRPRDPIFVTWPDELPARVA
jgi:hypothetical protein